MAAPVSAGYVLRPGLDAAVARCLSRGTGAYTLEGPAGAGKSATLLHGLAGERERRGKAGRGFIRILQLWGDEAPSLFASRLVREVGLLNFVPYPQPEKLAHLAADMAQQLPYLSHAGKLLAALLPDDMRPLPTIAAQALAESGARALQSGGPLCIGVDLQGGEVSPPVRDFFTRLCDQLPPTVVLLIAQPGGQNSLVQVRPENRLPAGPFTIAEAADFLEERLGRLDAASRAILAGGRLSLLPGDLAQIVNLYAFLGRDPQAGLSAVAGYLERDIASRYQMMFESQLSREGSDARLLELCALVAVTTRPQQPLTIERALRRLAGDPELHESDTAIRPIELSFLRQMPLLRALCATMAPLPVPLLSDGSGTSDEPEGRRLHQLHETLAGDHVGWPLVPANAQAREGVLQALARHGLLEVYERRWLHELLQTLRSEPGPRALDAGLTAMSLLMERAGRDKAALGEAVTLLGELETPLWHAGWHRAFAELYDALSPSLQGAGVDPRDIAPRLWFRRARARVQSVDWSLPPPGAGAAEVEPAVSALAAQELPLAIAELSALLALSETTIMAARARLGLPVVGPEVSDWCRQLPYKARQARGYARLLQLLTLGPAAHDAEAARAAGAQWQAAIDDIVLALSHFVAAGDAENIAQTLTILGDAYSLRGDADSDAAALDFYEQAARLAAAQQPPPSFAQGVIARSLGNHHARAGRGAAAALAYEQARGFLLRSPDARMGTLLARLLPRD